MSDTIIKFDAGEVLANYDDRTLTGLLIPHGEIGRTNAGEFAIEANAIDLPADPLVIGLNTDHERSAVVGRAERIWAEERGIFASFRVANTPEGDAALDAARDGTRSRLSAEFTATIDAARKLATKGRLWGAALVQRGAFPSAAVLAEEADTFTDETGTKWRRIDDDAAAVIQPIDTDNDQPESGDTTEEEDTPMTEQTVAATAPAGGRVPAMHTPAPAGLTARRNERVETVLAALNADSIDREQRRTVLASVFDAIASLRANPNDGAAREVLAALNDIKTSTITPGHITQPNWVGLISQGIAYQREYITLGNLGTAISLGGKKGYKVRRGTSSSPVDSYQQQGTWAGNKAAIGSFQGFSEGHTSTRRNFALGADFAREFYDLPGGAEAVEELIRLIVEDYYVWSDLNALADWNTTAGALVAFDDTKMPTGSYPAALGLLIQGILAVKRRKADGRKDSPSFAILNEAGYEQLLYAAGGSENLPEFVSIAVNTASEGTVDGSVRIVEGTVEGADESAPAAIVGAQYAIDFDELPGNSPLTLDALHIANGGIDRAIHGYLQTFVKRPEAVVKVGTAAA